MTDIVLNAIKKLSLRVNKSTGLAHPQDESLAKELFMALNEGGISLPADYVQACAKACGWSSRHAQALGVLAARIDEGISVRIRYPRGWGEKTAKELLGIAEAAWPWKKNN